MYHERNDQSVQHFDEKLENVLQLIKETNEEPIDEQEELKSVIVKAKSLKEIAEAKV